jgi:hypothetical protein
MTRFTPQYGNGHIAILDEAPAMQTAIEPVSHAPGWLVGAFLVRTMSCRFAKQTKGPPHLRFGFVTRSCPPYGRADPVDFRWSVDQGAVSDFQTIPPPGKRERSDYNLVSAREIVIPPNGNILSFHPSLSIFC